MDCPKRGAAVPGIPEELIVEILSRVPVKSLCRFKCISKAWRDLIADPFHRKKLPQTLEGFFYSEHEIQGCVSDACDCEGRGSDGGDCNEDGVDYGSEDGGDDDCSKHGHERVSNDEVPCHVYRCFIDLFGRSTRLEDPCFSFLTKLPGIERIRLLHYCNGLFLFDNIRDSGESVNYIVCNPATEQWVSVPSSGSTSFEFTYLIFDGAASSHFHVLQFCDEGDKLINAYSSRTGAWSYIESHWDGLDIDPYPLCAYVNGILYVVLYGSMDQIAAVDVEGNMQKIIPGPIQVGEDSWSSCDYVGQSQGRLHYIYHLNEEYDADVRSELSSNVNASGLDETEGMSYGLCTWALEDYDTNQWLLKHTVSFLELFGKMSWWDCEYKVVGIHPDCNLVFLFQHMNRKLISYNMDSKEVRDLCTLGDNYRCITSYVPCFSELSVLGNKH